MTYYCTLADARAELKAENTTDDVSLFNRVRAASERLDRIFQSRRPYFAPWNETRHKRVLTESVYSQQNTFLFDDNLLALTSVTLNLTALTVGTDVEAWPTIRPPFRKLRLIDWTRSWYNYLDTSVTAPPPYVQINGIWGFHRDYANAWLKVDDLAANITDSVTSLTVADIDGSDPYGRTPRLSAGALIRIGTEYMDVLSTNTTTNIATVRRGVNGSTAAAHSTNDDVDVWQVEEPVRNIIARQAAFKYARRGAYESAVITEVGAVQFPADQLAEVWGVVTGYVYD